jgi:hypothetical protein
MPPKNYASIVWDYPQKLEHREKIVKDWQKCSGNKIVPKNGTMITLGGNSCEGNKPVLAKQSELAFLLKKGIITHNQYFSIERDPLVHIRNSQLNKGN